MRICLYRLQIAVAHPSHAKHQSFLVKLAKELEVKLGLTPDPLRDLQQNPVLRGLNGAPKRTTEVSVYFDTDKRSSASIALSRGSASELSDALIVCFREADSDSNRLMVQPNDLSIARTVLVWRFRSGPNSS
jgi:hypothetical protein